MRPLPLSFYNTYVYQICVLVPEYVAPARECFRVLFCVAVAGIVFSLLVAVSYDAQTRTHGIRSCILVVYTLSVGKISRFVRYGIIVTTEELIDSWIQSAVM